MMRWLSLLLVALLGRGPAHADIFSLKTNRTPDEKMSVTLPPFASLILPGFDQWWEGQYQAAAIYSGTGLLGLNLAAHANFDPDTSKESSLDSFGDHERQYAYGLQLYQLAGELSAFHSFRSAVPSRQESGQFTFLTTEETTADLLKAPFELRWLTRPTTYIPLITLTGLQILANGSRHSLHVNDAAFVAGISFNAGVGEEALFRGYMMPLLRESSQSDFWSNSITATLFAAAHYSSENRFPIVQGMMGWYLGWLTQRNQWSLREAVFVHTWWDMLAIGFTLARADKKEQQVVYLPPFRYSF